MIYESELPDITKFTYLRSILKGEAKVSIQGLTLTNANYTVTIDILKKRLGKTDRIVFSHIEELLNISVPKQPRVSVLWELNDKLQAHVCSLEALGITSEQYGVLLCPVILSRLPPDLRLEWARENENQEGDLDWLLECLQNEISRRELLSRNLTVLCLVTRSRVVLDRPLPQHSLHCHQCQNHRELSRSMQ